MSELTSPQRPLPQLTDDSAAYWEAAREEKLVVQRCRNCKRHQFYPRAFCTACLSEDVEWVECSGRGRIYTYTVCRVAPSPAFSSALPYAVAIVELEEQVRLLANISTFDSASLAIGAPVAVCFERLDENCKLPQFKLIS